MSKKMFIPAGCEIADFEKEHKVLFVGGLTTERGIEATVIDLSPGFFVDVWNCRATVVLWGEEPDWSDNEYITSERYQYDVNLYELLVNFVVHNDNKGAINVSGQYYPRSERAVELFQQLMETVIDMNRWVTVPEAAKLIGVHKTTINARIWKRQVVARRSGRDWLVDKESLKPKSQGRKL